EVRESPDCVRLRHGLCRLLREELLQKALLVRLESVEPLRLELDQLIERREAVGDFLLFPFYRRQDHGARQESVIFDVDCVLGTLLNQWFKKGLCALRRLKKCIYQNAERKIYRAKNTV